MKPKSERLKVVLDLAERNEKKAMDDLAAAKRFLDDQESQLNGLNDYLKQYMHNMKSSMKGVVQISSLQSYQAFISQVETAINHQTEVVDNAQKQFEKVKVIWLACREKKKGLADLIARHIREELVVREKKESKQIEDDMTARRYQRK